VPERPEESTISQVLRRFLGAVTVLPRIETDGEEAGGGKPFEHGEHGVFRASEEWKPQRHAASGIVGCLIVGDPSNRNASTIADPCSCSNRVMARRVSAGYAPHHPR
jgi:hypothetical protein